MSYTFTSPIKNYSNKESLDHCSEIMKKVDGFFENTKTIFMVGWRKDSDKNFIDYAIKCGKEITILEVFPSNYESIPKEIKGLLGDIRTHKIEKKYDMFLWQHGPEHCDKEEVIKVLEDNQKMFKYIILESPLGINEQEDLYGNPYERHISTWSKFDYTNLGFEYITYAGPTNDHFILAYKENK